MRILVIEDEPAIVDFVQRGLTAEGYTVETEADGASGLAHALSGDIALVVLDRMLPALDGLAVLTELRAAKPTLPIIMLTARGEVADRVAGLDGGATDYLVKPFAFDELAARIRVHLRSPAMRQQTVLRAAGIEVDLLSREVMRDGVGAHLSTKEFDLLVCFMRNPGRVLSREQILKAVWGYDHEPGTNTVEVYVSYLRRKLDRDGAPAPIRTVRSAGYQLQSNA